MKGRTLEGEAAKAQDSIIISAFSPFTCRVLVQIASTEAAFIPDTGAAVTLLKQEVWDRLKNKPSTCPLRPWNRERLVGAGGTALKILGCTELGLTISEKIFTADVVVVESLMAEGILGMDFLERHQCSIDLNKKVLTLADGKFHTPLLPKPGCAKEQGNVFASDTFIVPPFSEMEVNAVTTQGIADGGVWLAETKLGKERGIVSARSLVSPHNSQVPIRVVNVSGERVTVYKGTKLAELEKLSESCIMSVEAGEECAPVTQEKQRMLWKVAEESVEDLTEEQKGVFFELLLEYADIFSTSNKDLGRTSKLKHTIHTGDSQPVRQPVRRLPPHRKQEMHTLLQEMRQNDVIQPSSSPWAAPIVLVRKKDGSTRFCVDYRKLNSVTRKDAYPLPRIDDTLDTLVGSRWFSTLDLTSGYWQVEMDEKDRHKTAFCTPEGLFEFNVMPFGLCNAPATFQRLMDLVLAGLQWSHCLVYLDDVIVLGGNFENHLHNLRAVFDRIQEAGLKLKPSKCAFLKERVEYLGHIVSKEGVCVDQSKVEKVSTWPTPTSTKEVQQFLGLANYYRRFIRDFAKIASPLHKLTERSSQFHWSSACQEAFEELRTKLTSAPVLAFPDFSRPFTLDTDASDNGIGAVLSQCDESGQEQVIAFASRLLTKAERQYCVTRKELLAVVTFTQHFRSHLLGRRFTLRTDHGSLTWLKNMKTPEGQLARWLEKLQEFDFEIVHRQGKKHSNADALSRIPCRQCGRQEEQSDTTVGAVQPLQPRTGQELRTLQHQDDTIRLVIEAKENSQRPSRDQEKAGSVEQRRLFQMWDQLVMKDGVLYRQFVGLNGRPNHLQLVVPKSLRESVLKELHEGALGGHLGEEKTLSRLKERYYWPGHWTDVRNWCHTCGICATRKNPIPKQRAPLGSIRAGSPMQIVATDILGPLPESDAGNSYILVVGDYFTRWMEAYPIPNQEATTVATKLVDEFFCRFSIPEQLHSDQGKQFESEVIAAICDQLHIDKTRTTPYHPQSDGLVERFNRTLVNMLATCTQKHPFDWETHVKKMCMAYNSSVQSSTGYSPFYLMFGRRPRIPVDILCGPTQEQQNMPTYAAALKKNLSEAYDNVQQNTNTKLDRQKELYNRRVHGDPHSPGDLVWLHNPAVPKGRARKFHRPWTGPHQVLDKLSDATYRIKNTHNGRVSVVHFDRLKKCHPNTRLPQPSRNGQQLRTTQPHPNPPRPIGSDLQLLDSDEQDQPNDAHRYPVRNRRPPERLMQYHGH